MVLQGVLLRACRHLPVWYHLRRGTVLFTILSAFNHTVPTASTGSAPSYQNNMAGFVEAKRRRGVSQQHILFYSIRLYSILFYSFLLLPYQSSVYLFSEVGSNNVQIQLLFPSRFFRYLYFLGIWFFFFFFGLLPLTPKFLRKYLYFLPLTLAKPCL